MNYGLVKVAAAVPIVRVADCRYNTQQIQSLIARASGDGASVVCFPELCITGYTCGDLLQQSLLLREAEAGLGRILEATRGTSMVVAVGLPVDVGGALANCAAVVQGGSLLGLVPKTYLPNYKEFYERRWFTSALDLPADLRVTLCGQTVAVTTNRVFRAPGFALGVELCEDLWAPVPPSCRLAMAGADIILNLSADNDLVGKRAYLDSLVAQQSARCLCGYVYAGCGYGESTQDVVFGGKAMVWENGRLLTSAPAQTTAEMLAVTEVDVEMLRAERRVNTTFAANASIYRCMPVDVVPLAQGERGEMRLTRRVDAHPFVPQGKDLDDRCREILDIQTRGLMRRVEHTACRALVVGVSGGLDSTLALLVSARAMDALGRDRSGVVGVTMPGFGTTGRTYGNAMQLMRQLGVTVREIPIAAAVSQHFADLGHDPAQRDVTYENCQARERTQILMDAANQMGGIVVGTGDMSELALGWATYNGDHMSMYGVNASVPKTLVRHLVEYASRQADEKTRAVLLDVIDTPVSPELLPADEKGNITQVTEDLVGPYELHDFFLYHTLRHGCPPAKIYMLACRAFEGAYSAEVIKHWLTTFFRRFFAQQFKRSCMPDGPKVGSCSLSPRGDWRMPSDASAAMWLAECEKL